MLRLSLLILLFVISLTSSAQNLQHLWSHAMGDGLGEDDESYTMCTDAKANLYVAGTFEGFIDFNPDTAKQNLLSSPFGENAYIAKFDSTGQLIWIKKIETLSSIKINEIALDNSGNLLIAGYYSNRIDFDPSADTSYAYSGTFNNANGFVAKYTNNGNLLWGVNIGGTSVDNATCLAIDKDNNVVVAGAFSDTVDFDPSSNVNQHIANSSQDIFLAKYDSTGNHLWAFGFGASINDYAQKVEIDSKGDIVVAGTFSNTTDFDPSSSTANLNRAGRNDAFIAKYTSSGAYKWAKNIGGTGNEYVYGMKVSNSGFIYLTGTFESTADFDPSSSTASISSNGRSDIFFAKYEPNGDYVWAKGIGTSSNEETNDLELDAQGNTYLIGSFVAQTDFDPSSSTVNLTPTNGDVFMAKYDSSGNYTWAKQIAGSNFENGFCLALDSFGKYWAGGYFLETVDFDPSATTRNLSSPDRRNYNSFYARYTQNTGAYDTAWAVQDRMGGDDEILDILHDSKGNVYATGYFEGGVDFDPSSKVAELNSNGGLDIFVAKYDSLGNYKWAFNIGAESTDIGYEITIDLKDNLYLSGSFIDTVDLDPSSATANIISNGSSDIFLAKYDALGNYKWGYGIGGASTDIGYGITTDSANNVWLTGTFRSTVDFNPGSGTNNLTARNNDAFLTKYDQFGNFKNAHFIGGSSNNYGYALVNGTDNCVYIAGEFRNTCDFDPSTSTANLSTSGTADPFIAKYDSIGGYVWAKGFNGSGADRPNDIALDEHENIYVVGHFQNSNDFDASSATVSITSGGGEDAFIASYSKVGNYRWAHGFGSNTSRNDRALAVDVTKRIINISGYFGDSVDFNPSSTADSVLASANPDNPFMLKLDTNGAFVEAAHLSATRGYGYALSAFGKKVYLGGAFQVAIDMNPRLSATATLLANGDRDIFIAQYGFVSTCKSTTGTITANVCGPYEAPSGGKFYHKSGSYIDTLINAEGCDSLITINLTIGNTFSYPTPIVCDSFKTASGKMLYKTGTYFDTIPNSNNCDSIIRYYLIVASNYRKITATACDTFYSPSGKYKYTSSGTYFDTLINKYRCDSIIEIELNITKSTFSTLTLSTCDSTVSPSKKYVYKSTGIYSDTLINWKGCDSIITINATINQTKKTKISPTACGSFISPSTKFSYTKSGVYFDTLKTVNGCDSIIEIELTIRSASSGIDTLFACDSLISPSGKYIYKQSGIYTDTLINAQGCDSVITLNVSINKTKTASVQLSSCEEILSPSGKFKILNTGTYFDTLKTNSGCDSIITITFKRLLPTNSNISIEACRSYTSPSGRFTYSTTGTFNDTLTNSAGCDSVITINLRILEPIETNISITACDLYKVPSGKRVYSTSGIYTDTLNSYKGCDSVITIDLTIIDNSPIISFNNNTLSVDLPSLSYKWLDCENDFAKIDSATRQEFRPTKSGEYTAVVFEEGCADTAACLDVIIVGMDENESNELSVYPNPAHDFLIIDSKLKIENLKVYSLESKVLLKAKNANQINIESLAPSIYFIEVDTKSGVERFRFVKE